MAKSKGKKKKKKASANKNKSGMTRQQFLKWLKIQPPETEGKKRGKKALPREPSSVSTPNKKKKNKSVPFPDWFFMDPPEIFPDPVYRPPGEPTRAGMQMEE